LVDDDMRTALARGVREPSSGTYGSIAFGIVKNDQTNLTRWTRSAKVNRANAFVARRHHWTFDRPPNRESNGKCRDSSHDPLRNTHDHGRTTSAAAFRFRFFFGFRTRS